MSQHAAETPAFHPPLGHKTLEIRGPRREPGDTTGWCAPEPLTVCLPLPGEPRRCGAPTAYRARGRVAEASLAALCPQRHPHPGDGGLQGLLDGRVHCSSSCHLGDTKRTSGTPGTAPESHLESTPEPEKVPAALEGKQYSRSHSVGPWPAPCPGRSAAAPGELATSSS